MGVKGKQPARIWARMLLKCCACCAALGAVIAILAHVGVLSVEAGTISFTAAFGASLVWCQGDLYDLLRADADREIGPVRHNGTNLFVTTWTRRQYLIRWAAYISMIIFAAVGVAWFLYQFKRLDDLNVVEKMASLPDKVDTLIAVLNSTGGR